MTDSLKDALGRLDEPGLGLNQGTRNLILGEAMAAFRSRVEAGPAARIAVFLPRVAWVSAMAIALLALSAPQFTQPAAPSVQDGSSLSVVASGPKLLSADYRDGKMVLKWSDADRGLFRVRQATSRKEIDQAPGVPVRGNSFEAVPPSNEQVLFYRVE